MYLNALEFLEEERDAWRPYEQLDALSDEQLGAPVEAAHHWSGRDLMAHLVAWQAVALDMAKELAVNETSPTKARIDREWDARGGEALNLDIQVEWRALPIEEVRRRFRAVSGELRGYLTVVPETRSIKNAAHLREFLAETIEHYADHEADLAAILQAAAGGSPAQASAEVAEAGPEA